MNVQINVACLHPVNQKRRGWLRRRPESQFRDIHFCVVLVSCESALEKIDRNNLVLGPNRTPYALFQVR
jgi:hypothetical protein